MTYSEQKLVFFQSIIKWYLLENWTNIAVCTINIWTKKIRNIFKLNCYIFIGDWRIGIVLIAVIIRRFTTQVGITISVVIIFYILNILIYISRYSVGIVSKTNLFISFSLNPPYCMSVIARNFIILQLLIKSTVVTVIRFNKTNFNLFSLIWHVVKIRRIV